MQHDKQETQIQKPNEQWKMNMFDIMNTWMKTWTQKKIDDKKGLTAWTFKCKKMKTNIQMKKKLKGQW